VTSERRVVAVVAAVQLVVVLDAVMVLPLGPDLCAATRLPPSQLGLLSTFYLGGAALAGLLGAWVLDRCDRRRGLLVALLGLVAATVAAGLAQSGAALLLSRALSGVCAGPATSLGLSLVADEVPEARRGRALATVMSALSIASIVGLPISLEIARLGGWRLSFFTVGGLGLAATLAARQLAPPPRHPNPPAAAWRSVVRPGVALALAATALLTISRYALIPNVSAYLQHNLGFPRSDLGLLYLAGGVCSFAAMRPVGALVDRYGSFRVAVAGAVTLALATYAGFARAQPLVPILIVFMVYMTGVALRSVSCATLASKVPAPHERARFLSLQSTVENLAGAAGAALGTALLGAGPGVELEGMDRVAWLAIAAGACIPPLLLGVERSLHRRQ
jgi:predicted MFS family arabinose efflux permease